MILGIISEAMQTQCNKCTEKQKALLNRMAEWYTENHLDQWNALVKKTLEDVQKKNN